MWHTVSRAMFNYYVSIGWDRRTLMVVSEIRDNQETCAAMEMNLIIPVEQSFRLEETGIPGVFRKV